MSHHRLYICKHKECPNFKKSRVVELGGPQKFECPMKLSNCEKDYLEALPNHSSWHRRLSRPTLIALALFLSMLIAWHWWPPPSSRFDKDVAIVMDGSIFMNEMLAQTPRWLAEVATQLGAQQKCAFALWACRPVDFNGVQWTNLHNYTPHLLGFRDFKALEIPRVRRAEQPPKEQPLAYDLFSSLREAIDRTEWHAVSNRNLIVISATSALGKSNSLNRTRFDERDIKVYAGKAQIKLFAIQLKIPMPDADNVKADQKTLYTQLENLTENVYTVAPNPPQSRMLEDYEGAWKSVLQTILENILAK